MKSKNKNELLFRLNKPVKRKITYNKDAKYQDYRTFLKEDFNGRCGYCDSYYGIVKKDYHIDHFVPKRVFEKISTHQYLLNHYDNLIYSCPSCNGSKSGKWPSENPDINICSEGGFINPCSDEYDELFFRDESGKILPKEYNEVAKYIYNELKLFLGRHQVVWKIEFLMGLIRDIEKGNESDRKELLVGELMNYLEKHFEMDILENVK